MGVKETRGAAISILRKPNTAEFCGHSDGRNDHRRMHVSSIKAVRTQAFGAAHLLSLGGSGEVRTRVHTVGEQGHTRGKIVLRVD